MAILLQILRHVLGDEDVAGITTIHHPLRDVDPGSRNVGATTYVDHAANRAAMDPHAQLQLWVFAGGTANFQRALHRCFGSVVKDQGHTVTSRHGNEPTLCLRSAEVFRIAHYLIEQLEQPPLLRSYKLGIADNVDEEHVGDLQLNFLFNLRGHGGQFYSVTSEGSTSFFRRQRGDDLPLWWQACRLRMCRTAADTRLRMSYGVAGGCLYSFGAREATIFSKRGSPRSGSYHGSSLRRP